MGHKELIAAQKAAKDDKKAEEKKDDKKEDKKDDDKKKKAGNWRDIVAKFGLTDEDVVSKDAADGSLKFVRIDGMKVPTDVDVWLFHGGPESKFCGVAPLKGAGPAVMPAATQTVAIEANDKGKAVAKLRFSVPLGATTAKKWADFQMQLPMDLPAPAADKPWSLPK